MQLGSAEHYEIIENFEKTIGFGYRLDKEKDIETRKKGRIYENGEVNNLFIAYCAGYSLARCVYLN